MNGVVALHPARTSTEIPALLVALVAVDRFARVWLERNEDPDYWHLPVGHLVGEQTPAEQASALAADRGLGASVPQAIGLFKDDATATLLMAYRMEVDSSLESTQPGLFLPLELAPLNFDPGHSLLAAIATGRKKEWTERLSGPSGPDYLAVLRGYETSPISTTISVPAFTDMLRERIATSSGPAKARQMMRLGVLLLLEGRPDRGRAQLLEACRLASQWRDLPTEIQSTLRLAELDDPVGAEQSAWKWISQLSIGERHHLDVPFAFLGTFAGQRNRRREADVYLRRALALCEQPERRVALRCELVLGSNARPALSAIS